MNQGDIVTIKWPGDTVAVKVPDWAKPGETVLKMRLGDLLEVIETPKPDESVSGVVVSDQQRAPAAQRQGYHGPTTFQKQDICKKCGETIYWFRSGRTGKWYACSSMGHGDFHSKVCDDNVKRKQGADAFLAGGGTAAQA